MVEKFQNIEHASEESTFREKTIGLVTATNLNEWQLVLWIKKKSVKRLPPNKNSKLRIFKNKRSAIRSRPTRHTTGTGMRGRAAKVEGRVSSSTATDEGGNT